MGDLVYLQKESSSFRMSAALLGFVPSIRRLAHRSDHAVQATLAQRESRMDFRNLPGNRIRLVKQQFQVGRGGGVGEAGEGGLGEGGVAGLALLLLRLQPITERHQLIHLRHNSLLFGEGGKR